MNQSYSKLDIAEFGSQLIATQDLDPVYTVLYNAQLDPDHLKRWLFAYSFSYSAGVVSYLSDCQGEEFWAEAARFASNVEPSPAGGRWPRGRERRYFRGPKCERSMQHMKDRFLTPEGAFTYFTTPNADGTPLTCPQIMARVEELPLYGPWIGFKVADLIDRVMGIPVEFTMPDVTFFESPRKAAKEWAAQYAPETPAPQQVQTACAFIAEKLGDRLAPPRFERKIHLAEIETVLCKYGSHLHFNYPIGIDTHELEEALQPWTGITNTAFRLLKGLPKAPPLPKHK